MNISPLLKDNLIAFFQSHPNWKWLEKISISQIDAFVKVESSVMFMKHRKRWIPIQNEKSKIESITPRKDDHINLLGLSSFNEIHQLLLDGNILTIVEKNPFLLITFFNSVDVASFLKEGKLVFYDAFHFFVSRPFAFTHQHSVLGKLYYDLTSKRLENSDFDVLMEGELMIDDWNSTLRDKGISCYNYPHTFMPKQKIVQDLISTGCQRLWSVNRVNGLSNIAEIIDKPYLIYEIDPDLSPLPVCDHQSTMTTIFSYRLENVKRYNENGWNSTFLALAAPKRMYPKPDPKYKTSLSFVGTSMLDNGKLLLSELKASTSSASAISLVDAFIEDQRSRPEEFLGEDYYQKWLDLGGAEFIDRSGFPAMSKKCFYEWSGSMHRIHLVKTATQFGIDVWGDSSWESISKESPGLNYKGEAGNLYEVPLIYSNTKFNLDITRNYQPDIYTLRVFDVMACGSMVLTNTHSPVQVFNEVSPPTFSKASEMVAQLERLFSWTDEEYAENVSQLKAEVDNHHRMSHRLDEILQSIQKES